MSYLGSWKINDFITFYCNTHTAATGAATDADTVPAYRIYEDETGTPITNGNMALLDAGNTVGFYSERVQLLAATGFEKGKQYAIYISATVAGVESTRHHTFQIEAEVDANTVSGTDEIADAVWDEILTSATHNIGYSAGQRLRYLILSGAVAQGGGVSTITLAATESTTDDIYTQNIVSIVGGEGAGQTRLIIEYDGGTRLATVDRPWAVVPNATSVYELLPFSATILAAHGTATAGGASSITFGPTALAIANSYVGCVVFIAAGTGRGQTRLITAYTAGRVATVSPAWDTEPDNTSVYKVLPIGRVIVESLSAESEAAIIDAVWDSARVDHTDVGTFGEGMSSVQGNVTGSVGSVTGNLGGNVDGNVTGTVASVVGDVGGNVVGDVQGNVDGNVAGSVGSVAANGITAASIAADAITSSELATSACQEIADNVLARGVAGVEATADPASLAALILAAFESAIAGAVWTIYRTDHATVFATRTVTTDDTADPIVEVT